MSSRIVQPVSDKELDRRLKEVQSRMEKRSIDLLLVASNSKLWSGYVRYFTNYLTVMYPEYLIIPVDGEVAFVAHYGQFVKVAKEVFGIKEAYNIPANPTRSYAVDGQYVADHVRRLHPTSIGIVGFGELSAAFYQKFTSELSEVKIEDATDLVDEVRAIKSHEEMNLVEKCAAICDAAIEECTKALRPGRKEYEVMNDVDRVVKEMGSEEQYYMAGSSPPGEPIPYYCVNLWNRTVHEGDVFRILVEISGPGGYYTEIGRMLCLGSIPEELERSYEVALEAHRKAVESLKPGLAMSEVYEVCFSALTEAGYPRLTALYGHGQGIDVVEKPFVDPDERFSVQVGMNLAVHPSASTERTTAFLCDNYIINESGAKRIHKTSQDILTV